MFQAYFYVEHVDGYNSDFWVQWLYADGTGHADIDNWSATLWIAQGRGTLPFRTTEVDVPASAFLFHLDGTTSFEFGAWDARITVHDDDQVNSPDTHRQIAVGTVHIMEGLPS